MSKMSQLHAELEQQAYEKGYESLDEALNDGATIIGGTLLTGDDIKYVGEKDEQTKAHEAWLKRKEVVVGDLRNLLIGMHAAGKSNTTDYDIVSNALTFIEEGEM